MKYLLLLCLLAGLARAGVLEDASAQLKDDARVIRQCTAALNDRVKDMVAEIAYIRQIEADNAQLRAEIERLASHAKEVSK